MVCLRNMSINTVHKGENNGDDDDDDDNNKQVLCQEEHLVLIT